MKVAVAEQVAKKLKLENKLKPVLRKFFKQLSSDVKTIWVTTHTLPTLDSYQSELSIILRQHYRDVAKVFKTTTRDSIKCADNDFILKQNEQENDTENAIALGILLMPEFTNKVEKDIMAFINKQSQNQASIILDTTQQELQNIAAKIITDASGKPFDNIDIGNQIENEFNKSSIDRVDTIATTETQISSEKTKWIEAAALAIFLDAAFAPEITVKTWNAVMDSKTRPAHAAANGQQVNINQTFIVGGERLSTPGDMTHGASIGNIIHCRCVATYGVIKRPPLHVTGLLQ